MNAYVDSSVVLRVVFGEANRLAEFDELQQLVASTLLHVECYRSIDRARLARVTDAERIAAHRIATAAILERVTLLDINPMVIARAVQPLPFAIRTLDAIHLATALQWRDRRKQDIAFATHDRALADAARATGFRVLGA